VSDHSPTPGVVIGEGLDRLHSAFTKTVTLHVTVWTRAYGDADGLW
jgi:hypothetical protein